MRVLQILADPRQRLFQRQACVHADHSKVQRVSQTQPDATLPSLDLLLQKELGQQEPQSYASNQERQE